MCTGRRAARDTIYAGLLQAMSPEHKFSSAAKLCSEVLAGVADGLLPLSECEEVLRDALVLMASKDIKVGVGKGGFSGAMVDSAVQCWVQCSAGGSTG